MELQEGSMQRPLQRVCMVSRNVLEDVPVWHTLNTSPSHGSCSRACACEGQTGMATEG